MPATKKKGTIAVKSTKKIVFVTADDWEGLYVDGKLRFENHSIRPYNIAQVLEDCEVISCDEEWLEERGFLPENLGDVKIP